MSNNLLTYKEARIEALLQKIKDLELENERLTTYIFELSDEACPKDYKRIVRSDVFSRD